MVVHKKHPFILLEVLIAFVLVALCIIPLISPHIFILREEKRFIQEVELDHFANLVYAKIIEKMYRGEIVWSSIENKIKTEINSTLLENEELQQTSYRGSWQISEIKHKPKKDSLRKIYLLKVELFFVLEGAAAPFTYTYAVFAIRDLGNVGPLTALERED